MVLESVMLCPYFICVVPLFPRGFCCSIYFPVFSLCLPVVIYIYIYI